MGGARGLDVADLLEAGGPGRNGNAKRLGFQDGCSAAEADLTFVCLLKCEGLREAFRSRPEAGTIGCDCVLGKGVHQLRHAVVELVLQPESKCKTCERLGSRQAKHPSYPCMCSWYTDRLADSRQMLHIPICGHMNRGSMAVMLRAIETSSHHYHSNAK